MIVSDSSPLIGLARIGEFSLLKVLFAPQLVLPPAVYDDVVTRGRGRPGEPEVKRGMAEGWIERRIPAALIGPPFQGMHRGEIEAISLALELRSDLLIDEGPGRRRAIAAGVFWRGTLDVLILAKRAGTLMEIRPSLDALVKAQFRLSNDQYLEALRKAGESV